MPDESSGESASGRACVYRHIARCVFTTIFINHKYSCSGVFNFILPSQAPYEDIQEEDCLMSPAGTKRTSQSSYVVAVSSSMCHALLDVPACYMYVGYRHHASTRRQARTDGGGGGEKESSVPELNYFAA